MDCACLIKKLGVTITIKKGIYVQVITSTARRYLRVR